MRGILLWVHTTIRSIRDFSQKCMTQEGPNSRGNIVKNGIILTKTWLILVFSDLLKCIHDISTKTALLKGLFVCSPADKYTICICAMRRDWIMKNTVLFKYGTISKNLIVDLSIRSSPKVSLSKFYKITKLPTVESRGFWKYSCYCEGDFP